jgi:hypothetical protein
MKVIPGDSGYHDLRSYVSVVSGALCSTQLVPCLEKNKDLAWIATKDVNVRDGPIGSSIQPQFQIIKTRESDLSL